MGLNPDTVYWMDIFSHIFVVKIVMVFFGKTENKWKRGRGWSIIKNKGLKLWFKRSVQAKAFFLANCYRLFQREFLPLHFLTSVIFGCLGDNLWSGPHLGIPISLSNFYWLIYLFMRTTNYTTAWLQIIFIFSSILQSWIFSLNGRLNKYVGKYCFISFQRKTIVWAHGWCKYVRIFNPICSNI